MKSLLARNENLDEVERRKIVERFIPFEQLWEKSPGDEKMGEVYYKKEREKGKAKGHTEPQKNWFALEGRKTPPYMPLFLP
jgi:hypothetical protein